MYSHTVTFKAEGPEGQPYMELTFKQYYDSSTTQVREQEPFVTKLLGAVMEQSLEHKSRDAR